MKTNQKKAIWLLIVGATMGCPYEASAQRPPASPLAPNLALPMPMGAQRGAVVELTLTGTNLAGPLGVVTSFPAKITIPKDNNNGQDNAKLRVQIDVPATAALGYGTIHLATSRGISNPRLFCIDDLPQIVETGMNRSAATAQAVPVPGVVCGRVDAQKATVFKFAAKAGQRLAFDLIGRRLGCPLDAQMAIIHEESGRMVAYDHDAPGLQTDPRIVHTFKADGNYLIEIKDVLNRGGADYAFRLRIGDFPCAVVPIPMAAKRGSKATITFAGPEATSAKPVNIDVPSDPTKEFLWVTPQGNSGLSGWPVLLGLSDLEQIVEQEPNDDVKKGQVVPFPCGITGRYPQSGDTDVYRFTAKKGQPIVIQAQTAEWHSPTLVYLVLRNAKTGGEIAKSNPEAAPPADQTLEFTPPDDGDYLLEVQHLNFAGGSSEAYHVSLRPKTADFKLVLGADRCDVPADGYTAIPVDAVREGYNGPIAVRVESTAGVTGSATIPAGQKSALIALQAKPGMPALASLVVVGEATIDNQKVVRSASLRSALGPALADLPYPPRLADVMALVITEPVPLALTAKLEPAEVFPGASVKFTVIAKRGDKLDDVVNLNAILGVPANVTVPKALPPIAKGKQDSTAELKVAANAPIGVFDLMVSGKIKQKVDEFQVYAAPLRLIITNPVALKVEPGDVKLAAGDKATLKIATLRKAGYKGPLKIEVRKLPTGVTATSPMIADGMDGATVEIQAAANAALGEKRDVEIAAIATGAGNLTEIVPFVITIEKK